MSLAKSINILGVTGSVGQAAVDVVLANPEMFDVKVISAHRDEAGLAEAAARLGADVSVLTSRDDVMAAMDEPVDLTLCAIGGMAGLPSMMKAIEVSKAVGIANKEPLVAAGPLVMAAAREHGAALLPIDSEHNAVFQVFEPQNKASIERITLSASGGPFRTWSREEMARASVEEALRHPNWSMGRKITIDSATMMNKGLEVIEAAMLFDLPPEQIDVVIHPQSIVHAMVSYTDGSVLAQMGASDMRTPIASVMGYPSRIASGGGKLDLQTLSDLTFLTPDYDQFPFLPLAYECLRAGQAACLSMNAANEVAVDAFLNGAISFGMIYNCVKDCLDHIPPERLHSLSDVLAMDQMVRSRARDVLNLPSSDE